MAQSLQTPEWTESAARMARSLLVDLARTSAWAEPVSSLTSALEDSAWLEAFADAAGIEIEPSEVEASSSQISTEPTGT